MPVCKARSLAIAAALIADKTGALFLNELLTLVVEDFFHFVWHRYGLLKVPVVIFKPIKVLADAALLILLPLPQGHAALRDILLRDIATSFAKAEIIL